MNKSDEVRKAREALYYGLNLRLSREESIELYLTLVHILRRDDTEQLPPEIFEITGKLQRRMADYEITEHIRVYGFLRCIRCNTEGFREKATLVRHVMECYGVILAEALTIIHNLFRPTLILRGR